jgi:hypothetical protein
MFALALVGFLLSIGWACFGARNYAYNQAWVAKLREIEDEASWKENKFLPQNASVVKEVQRRGSRIPLGFQRMLLAGTPIFFSALYLVIGETTLNRLLLPFGVFAVVGLVAGIAMVITGTYCWSVTRDQTTGGSAK